MPDIAPAIVTDILHAHWTDHRDYCADGEYGDPDPADYPWLDLPAERALLAGEGLPFTDDVSDWYPPEPEPEQCHHGLSAWLCADPISHYPRDL